MRCTNISPKGERTRISPWGKTTPFSSRGDVGVPHMATLLLPGLLIRPPVWLFSTSTVQSIVIPEQSNQQPDDTRVTPQPSTSFVSPSPSSSLGEAGKAKNQVTEKKKKGKEKKKKEPKAKRGNHASSSENPQTALSKPKSPCVICRGDHYHPDCPCTPRILSDWSPCLHNLMSSTSDRVESTPSISESEVFG